MLISLDQNHKFGETIFNENKTLIPYYKSILTHTFGNQFPGHSPFLTYRINKLDKLVDK